MFGWVRRWLDLGAVLEGKPVAGFKPSLFPVLTFEVLLGPLDENASHAVVQQHPASELLFSIQCFHLGQNQQNLQALVEQYSRSTRSLS